jgi:hypothetical protein
MKRIQKLMFLIVFFAATAHCQSLSIGVSSGINVVRGKNYYTEDLGPDGIWFVNGAWGFFHGLKFGNEPDFALATKYSLKVFDLTAQIHFIPMRGGQVVEVPMFDGKQTRILYPSVTTKMDIWSFQVGARYSVEVRGFRPFFAASCLMSYFGDTRLQFDYGDLTTHLSNYTNGMRYGYRVGLGVGYTVTPKFDIELGGGFNSMNPVNGRAGEGRMNTIDIALSAYYTIFE